MFGGQGGMDSYLEDAQSIVEAYHPLVIDFVAEMSLFLQSEAADPRISRLYPRGFDVLAWFDSPKTGMPPGDYFLLSQVSIPVVGLIQFMNLMVAYKTLGISPGELAQSFKAAVGHSQGMAVATALSVVTDEQSFYVAAKKILGILVLAGAYTQMGYPYYQVSPNDLGEASTTMGKPYPMLSVRGIRQQVLEGYIDEFNSQLDLGSSSLVYLSLVNTHDQLLVSAELPPMTRFVEFLHSKSAKLDEDQSRVPFTERKPKIRMSYVAITAPYHCELQYAFIDRQCEYAASKGWSLDGADMRIPVRSCCDGHDIRGEAYLTRYLFECMCALPVNWPKAIDCADITHIVDFSPSSQIIFSQLAHKNVEGRGVRVIRAGALATSADPTLGTKADLYKSDIDDTTRAPHWQKQFGPKLVRTLHDGKIHIDSPMHRVLGKPPVMVAGMTPTTVSEDFVAAINNAGYHAELAGGGMYSKAVLRDKITRLVSLVDPGQEITLNCIYINQKQWGFQLPAILQMRREGVPIAGLCIGGGIPSTENANEIIDSLRSAGFRHVAFKPANPTAIEQVVAIAKQNSDFPVILQWTGGRGGGHHSYEDFHEPILETYASIRSQPNIVLVAGSGFGDAQGTLPYITGDWSTEFGRAPMPFDGILLGSRVMAAKEAKTSDAAKELIVATPGLDDSGWERTFAATDEGVITVVSEYGELNHAIATRGSLFVREITNTILSQPREKQLPLLLERKDEIIQGLNEGYQRPWFGKKASGQVADLKDMTYAEVVRRIVELMYIKNKQRWIDPTYCNFLACFLHRIERRFCHETQTFEIQSTIQLLDPFDAVDLIVGVYPQCQAQLLTSDDIQFFINLCKRRGQKPVPFIPILDEDFAVWFKKDTAWQSEDLDAVIDSDVQRVFVQHGPVAAGYSTQINEPVKNILDGIYHGHTKALLDRFYGGDSSNVPTAEYIGQQPKMPQIPRSVVANIADSKRILILPSDPNLLPETSEWLGIISGSEKSWLHALLTAPVIVQGTKHVANFVQKVLHPRPNRVVRIMYEQFKPRLVQIFNNNGDKELEIEYASYTINLGVYHRIKNLRYALLQHRFRFIPSQIVAPIHEIMLGRDERIRKFYTDCWVDTADPAAEFVDIPDIGSSMISREFEISKDHVARFCHIVGNKSRFYMESCSGRIHAPMDFLFIAATSDIARILSSSAIGSGQLGMLHLNNSISLGDAAFLLEVGDRIRSEMAVDHMVNTDTGKQLKVTAKFYNGGKEIGSLSSTFVYSGVFIQNSQAFKREDGTLIQTELQTAGDVAALESKDWFVYREQFSSGIQPGSTLEFKIDSRYRYKTNILYSSVVVKGNAFLVISPKEKIHVADVDFEGTESLANPVFEYLKRQCVCNSDTVVMFDDEQCYEIAVDTDSNPSWLEVDAPETNWEYSAASFDFNPIHTNPYIASMAGLPGTITHGMWTSASTRALIEQHAADGYPERVRSYSVSFLGMVLPGDRLTTKLLHVGMKDGRMLVKGQTFRDTGELVLECMAEVDQPTTAYVFTGQGSQKVGMGMDLYATSAAARDVWDRADKHMARNYGISLLDIVRSNPREQTVYFYGSAGKHIRQTYLSFVSQQPGSGCSSKAVPLFPDVNSETCELTFKSSSGLLNATQFTQPALLVCELAAVADLRCKALVQKEAAFAGHSLGEYSALASIGSVFSVENAIDIAFYRGMIMQNAIERDDSHRSQYAMVAVDPSRVHKDFNEESLGLITSEIREQGSGLLEIVNYNVRGSQYVVAGTLSLLHVLGSTLDFIAEQKLSINCMDGAEAVRAFVKATLLQAKPLSRLKRGIATIPLAGIDVPFHSTKLSSCVETFRNFLSTKIGTGDVDYDKLRHRYVPNLTAKPFEMSKSYLELVHSVTKSPVIQNELQNWGELEISAEGSELDRLGRILLIELLAYQFASPVRWIETQEYLFGKGRVKRFIEFGPTALLCGMAEKSAASSASAAGRVSILHSSRDENEVQYVSDRACGDSHVAQALQSKTTDAAARTGEAEKDEHHCQPRQPQVAAPSPADIPATAAAVGDIQDKPLEALDIIQAVIAQKLKRTLDAVPVSKTVKELADGKSTLQNEIMGDLNKEFEGNVPDRAEELSIKELSSSLSAFSRKLGKHTSAQIARLFSSKMPGGFTQSSARAYLQGVYGLPPSHQDALLLVALTMAPAERIATEAEAKAWLQSVAQAYANREGISLSAMGSSGLMPGAVSGQTMVNSAEFDRAQRRQHEHTMQQIQVFARYAGIDLRQGARSAETARAESAGLQHKLDKIVAEFGEELIDGSADAFDVRKARHFDSYWNWAREDALLWINDALLGARQTDKDMTEAERLLVLANRSTEQLVQMLSAMATLFEKSHDSALSGVTAFVQQLHRISKESLDSPPVYKELMPPTRPVTEVSVDGSISYSEVPREGETSVAQFVQNMRLLPPNSDHPSFNLRAKSKPSIWSFNGKYTEVFFDSLESMAESGLTFRGMSALITGCSRGSIGADILRGLLMGGARVVATTSSYCHGTVAYYERMYKRYGARGSELVVVPFNQASTIDIRKLVQYVFGSKGLGWDIDYIFPFAAIGEAGKNIAQISSKSELALRIGVTNIIRLLGEIKAAKQAQHKHAVKPALAVLPLSPNHGSFGDDGLYGESKIALQTLFNRWESEDWAEYLSISGAAIGWTRGTGLMDENSQSSQDIESLGVRTFSTREMAFGILGLLHPAVHRLAQREPIWAELTGGVRELDRIDMTVRRSRRGIQDKATLWKHLAMEHTKDFITMMGHYTKYITSEWHDTPLADYARQHCFPPIASYGQLEPLRHLQGMVNLDRVVVVSGYGEVGPFGNAQSRWEMEAFGEFSIEGCIELAWVMGLIKHYNGPLKDSGMAYTGWVDAKTSQPVKDIDVKTRYEKHILEHTGIRLIEPEMMDGYDPNMKQFLRELQTEHDMEPFEASAEEAASFKHKNGDRVDVWENGDGSWSVRFLKGAIIHIPRALNFDRLVGGQLPTGWDPTRYGIPEDIVKQVDPVTCYAIVATVEALVRSGITDPYELYSYFHVAEVGSTISSAIGGVASAKNVFKYRYMEKEMNNDVLQETFINTTAAWINMLLMSSSGPIKPAVGACATALVSIEVAIDTIQSGKAKVMLAGACEAFVEESSYEFAQMGATSSAVEEFASGRTPQEMSRPCTSTRSGFVEGNGSGAVVLMSASAALEFGAPIYGILAMTGTATDKQASSVPAPGKGVLSLAREAKSIGYVSPLLDIDYRRRQLNRQLQLVESWAENERAVLEKQDPACDLQCAVERRAFIDKERVRQKRAALDTWGSNFWQQDKQISPLRGGLAVWGLGVDDIGVVSFHGTSTLANDRNESQVLDKQLQHLGRTPGLPVPVICQKWLTGHSKGPAAGWVLNGVLQVLETGVIPGNRNADNISAELEEFEHLVYPSQSIKTPGIKAGLVTAFGFGQVGGEILVVHPDYLLATLTSEQLDMYRARLQAREKKSYRYWQDTLAGNHGFVQIKSEPPYTAEQEQHVYLDPAARAKYDPVANKFRF
ncbi:fatty acid synthase alpha subunit Lsd1 [Dipsacomyces acuminosporus]|nr:fatty acid synthase alpha subunit Lsd1 [Dipsacomyces acuminosporus]